MSRPLISCICVTRNRPEQLKRAVACFDAQTYPDRELVLLYEDDDEATTLLARQWQTRADIRLIQTKKTADLYLGALRNIAIEAAGGAFICQWDDDDWHHPERLHRQYETLESGKYLASVLQHWLIFDAVRGCLYLSSPRHWEGSILCSSELMRMHRYRNLSRGEDTEVITSLAGSRRLRATADLPYLYIYVAHGINTWSYRHFRTLFKAGKALSPGAGQAVAALLGMTGYGKDEDRQILEQITSAL